MRPAAETRRARRTILGTALANLCWTRLTIATSASCHPCPSFDLVPKCCRGRSVGKSDDARGEKFGRHSPFHSWQVPAHMRLPSQYWRSMHNLAPTYKGIRKREVRLRIIVNTECNMKKVLAIAAFLSSIALPAFAQSYDPDLGTGNIVPPIHSRYSSASNLEAQEQPQQCDAGHICD